MANVIDGANEKQKMMSDNHNDTAIVIEMEPTHTPIPTVSHVGLPPYPTPRGKEDEVEYDDDEEEDEAGSGWEDSENDDIGDDDGDGDNAVKHCCTGGNVLGRLVENIQNVFQAVGRGVQKVTRGYFIKMTCVALYLGYFITALCYRLNIISMLIPIYQIFLIGCTVLMAGILFRQYIFSGWGCVRRKVMGTEELSPVWRKRMAWLRSKVRWILYFAVAAVSLWALIDEGMEKPSNLRSIPGLVIFVLICLFMSSKPSKINWHTIYWSLGLQFLLALFALRWQFGKDSVYWLQSRLDEYFANTKAGSSLLFGENYKEHQLIFGSLPVFIFTNATIAILYYLGAMQFLIRNIGNFLQYVLETSPIESTSVAAGIFLEGIASVAALIPYMHTATRSQLFLIMTSGFASIGGAYLALLSSVQIPVEHLIAAMVISAPATFAVSKLMMPETQRVVQCSDIDVGDEQKKKYTNILDALQSGSMVMLGVVGNVAVNAFSLWSFISWINATLTWFGDRVGIEELTLEEISSYVLYPVSLAMGVEPEDCRNVAMLLGYRISSTNLVAFIKMIELKVNRIKHQHYQLATNYTGPVSHHKNDVILDAWNMTLKDGFISERSEAIATYSLTGFSSFVSAAILLAMFTILLPKRKAWVAKTTMLSLLAGNIANCMTGCFASLFY